MKLLKKPFLEKNTNMKIKNFAVHTGGGYVFITFEGIDFYLQFKLNRKFIFCKKYSNISTHSINIEEISRYRMVYQYEN